MKYLVDTSIWSLAFRRSEPRNEKVIQLLSELIDKKQVILCGPIRQELLSGIKHPQQFNLLKQYLHYFEDFKINSIDYELAAEFYNECRSKGIQGSNTDFLLCAIAVNHNLSVLTADRDFLNFKNYIDFTLEYVNP